MTTQCLAKQSHADTDWKIRQEKARRIAALLHDKLGDLSSKDVLDIGTGAGVIASYTATRVRSLLSVDVVDERIVFDFEFRLVQSERLPLGDDSVDIVISNHVIEHVDDQMAHLREIRRVLRPGGVCYLATPNRFAVLEPHFRLPFLSWLPECARDRYVRLARRGEFYDVRPLTYTQLLDLARRAGLTVNDCSSEVARYTLRERLGIGLGIPSALRPLFPSFVVLLGRGA